jgi:hypothetical protein
MLFLSVNRGRSGGRMMKMLQPSRSLALLRALRPTSSCWPRQVQAAAAAPPGTSMRRQMLWWLLQ